MIRFTGYGVIAEKSHFGQLGRIFPCHAPCRKNYALDQKRLTPFWWSRWAISPSLGKIVQCAPAVGENVVFVFWSCSKSGPPCVQGVHSLNKHCVAVYRPISTRFSAFFSEGIALSDALHSSHFLSLGDAAIFAKLRSKIVKSLKNQWTSLCAPLRIDSWRIKKNSTAVV